MSEKTKEPDDGVFYVRKEDLKDGKLKKQKAEDAR